MNKIIIIVAFIFPTIIFGQFTSDSIRTLNLNFILDSADYAVLPFEKEYFPSNSKSFNLTPSDIKLLEKMLIESVIEHNSNLLNNYNLIILNNYKIQFRAFISKSNKKLVHIHGSHKDSFERSQHFRDIWRKQVVGALDGGHWFFQVWINWDERKVNEFTINFY